MILLDTSGLLAAIDASQRHHETAMRALVSARPPRLLSPFVLAELDYLLAARVGSRAQLALLEEVARGVYRLEPFGRSDVAAAQAILSRHSDLDLGLADASLVVLAERHGVRDILTLDDRHFRAVLGLRGRPFRLLPFDSGDLA